jgi:hypothetical protein
MKKYSKKVTARHFSFNFPAWKFYVFDVFSSPGIVLQALVSFYVNLRFWNLFKNLGLLELRLYSMPLGMVRVQYHPVTGFVTQNVQSKWLVLLKTTALVIWLQIFENLRKQ